MDKIPAKINSSFLRTRYWIATAAILGVLSLCVAVSWSLLQSIETHTRYARAFSSLMEATYDLRSAVTLKIHSAREYADSETTPSIDLDRDSSENNQHVSLNALKQSFHNLAVVFSAIRLTDEDGIHDPDEGGDLNEVDEEDWDLIAYELIDELESKIEKFELSNTQMPERLIGAWEAEEDASPGYQLERSIGTVLELASELIEAENKGSSESIATANAIDRLISNKIGPDFRELGPMINQELADQISTILAVVVLSALAILGVTLFNTFIIFAPMERAIVQNQRAITLERDKAIAAEEAKRGFLAVMSHELRTPLNGIMGFANLLLGTELNQHQKDYTETIYGSGETLMGLLNNILDISKIESGALDLEQSDFELKDVVTSVVKLLGPQAYKDRIEIGTFIDPDLPEYLNGDAGRIRQILLNLVGNAIKFTSSGAIAIELTRERHPESGNHALRISVSDTGVGIPEDKLAAIFDRFVQVDGSSNRKYEGTGLGLSICKQLAELMGGEIGVESRLDRGSTFWVVLIVSDATGPVPKPAETAPESLSGKRILVVDDNALNRRILKLQLTGTGADLQLVPDARAALRALATAREAGRDFDLAIVDHMMPDITGLELAKMVRANKGLEGVKLILSSSSCLGTDQQARALGFDASCPKPLYQDQVLATVRLLLSSQAVAPAHNDDRLPGYPDNDPSHGIEDNHGAKDRILLVEDNAINQRLALKILTDAGYSVDAVGNGLEAVNSVQALPYDLILMDIRMPIMDGIEATKRIRALTLSVSTRPIIAMTANAVRGDREECLAAGMNDYISKPIDARILLEKVAEHLPAPSGTAASGAAPHRTEAGTQI